VLYVFCCIFFVVFHFLCLGSLVSLVCRGLGSLHLGCALCSGAKGSHSFVCVMWVFPASRCSVMCSVVCGFVFIVSHVSWLGFCVFHLPSFAFALYVVEYDFSVWELAR
jgi:hypothetical protein